MREGIHHQALSPITESREEKKDLVLCGHILALFIHMLLYEWPITIKSLSRSKSKVRVRSKSNVRSKNAGEVQRETCDEKGGMCTLGVTVEQSNWKSFLPA